MIIGIWGGNLLFKSKSFFWGYYLRIVFNFESFRFSLDIVRKNFLFKREVIFRRIFIGYLKAMYVEKMGINVFFIFVFMELYL